VFERRRIALSCAYGSWLGVLEIRRDELVPGLSVDDGVIALLGSVLDPTLEVIRDDIRTECYAGDAYQARSHASW